MAYLKEKGYEARAFYLNIIYLILIILGTMAAGTLNAELKYSVSGKEVTAPRYRRCFLNGTQDEYTTAALPDSMYGKGCIAIEGTEDADGKFTAGVTAKDATCSVGTYNPTTEVCDDSAATLIPGISTEQAAEQTETAESQQEVMDQIFNISLAAAVINGLLFVHSIIMHFSSKFGIGMHFKFQWVFSIINLGLFAGLVGWLNSVKDIQEAVNVDNNIYFVDVNLFLVAVFGVVLTTLDTIGSNLIVYVLCTSDKGYVCNPST
jgi:hypothetical protein